MALIVQGFPRFRRGPLAQNDKSPALADHCIGQRNPARPALLTLRTNLIATVLATSLTAAAFPGPADAIETDYRRCLPTRLHPVSAKILTAFLDGRLTEGDFRWGFHLPNSDYLPVTDCILAALTAFSDETCAPGMVRPDGLNSCFLY